jgi:hypothetical protein
MGEICSNIPEYIWIRDSSSVYPLPIICIGILIGVNFERVRIGKFFDAIDEPHTLDQLAAICIDEPQREYLKGDKRNICKHNPLSLCLWFHLFTKNMYLIKSQKRK